MVTDLERVLGDVPFASNVRVPGMLHCRIVRSTMPHARLTGIHTSAARRMPGVHAVVTGDDLCAHTRLRVLYGPVVHDQPVLALERVRYVGEPVAAVVAETPEDADEAAAAVVVDYDELPAVFSVDEAMAHGAPRLFEAQPEIAPSFVDVAVRGALERNICSTYRIARGDVDQALAHADTVFEHTFSSPAVQHVPLESHACVAIWRGGRLTVHSGTQTPFIVRSQLAEIFGVPHSRVRVVAPPLGGGFGAKTYANIEPLVAALSYLIRRPVRLHLSRDEEFVTVTKHAMQVTLTTGVSRDGLLVARKATGYYNAGAYAGISPRKIMFGAYGVTGPYNVPHVRNEMSAVYTNTPPAGAYRGFAINQCAWAYESQMDMIAASLKIDRVDFRLKNVLREGDRFCTGEVMGDVRFADALRRVAVAIGYGQRSAPISGDLARGIGLSCIIEGTITPSTSTALVKLNMDGSVDLMTAAVEMGQGIQQALRRITAAELGIDIQSVSVAEVDTDVSPYDQQTTASRSVFSVGRAIQLACEEIREQLALLGGRLLGTATDVSVENGRIFVRDDPTQALTYGQVVSRSGVGNVMGRGTFRTEGGLDPETGQGVASAQWHQSAGAAEVEVDRRTGHVRVVAYRSAINIGRVIDPVGADLQCEGAITFGIGNALLEELVFDHGSLINGTLADYMIPALKDVPEARSSELLEAFDGASAEPHGLGEMPLPPVAPAIGNAVFDAVGVRLTDLPLSAEKVLRALREKDARDVSPSRHDTQEAVASR